MRSIAESGLSLTRRATAAVMKDNITSATMKAIRLEVASATSGEGVKRSANGRR